MIVKQRWSFRAECRRDVEEWFPEAYTATRKREWEALGVEVTLCSRSGLAINGASLPDVELEVEFSALGYREHGPCYRGYHRLMIGICDVADIIGGIADTHVILGSLKPSSLYDGERNGPFLDGSKMVRAMMEFDWSPARE